MRGLCLCATVGGFDRQCKHNKARILSHINFNLVIARSCISVVVEGAAMLELRGW